MAKKGHSDSIFNFVAPIYGMFYKYQKRTYRKVLDNVQDVFDYTSYKNLLDVGCGTGALCSVFRQKGLVVTGVDQVSRMLQIASRKQENKAIEFIQANILEILPFEDKKFDISIASYVAHGLTVNERNILYAELNRITKHWIIIYDYNEKQAFFTNLIEWFEGGDYFNFIKIVKLELAAKFKNIKVIDVSLRAAWYICKPH